MLYSDRSIQDWIIKASLNHPQKTIFCSLLLTVILMSGLKFLVIDDDMMKMLPKDIESRLAWDSVQEEFGSTEIIYIAFGNKSKNIFTQDAFSTLWDVSDGLENFKYVEDVSSLSTLTRMDNVDDFMDINDLQPRRLLELNEINDIKSYLNRNSKQKQRFVSKNDEFFMITVQPYEGIGLDQFRDQVVQIVEPLLTNYESHFGGTAYMTGSIPGLIRDDVKALMKAGVFIMVLVLLINLRSFIGVGIVLLLIGLSLGAMMGFMGWAYKILGSDKFLFTMVNSSMPIILLTIANSDGVHVITKFFREMRNKNDSRQAIESTMRSLLTPVFLTSITTVAAFLTMVSAPLEPLIGYGFTISAGILWACFLSSFFLPALISLIKWDKESVVITKPSILEKFINKISPFLQNKTRITFIVGLTLIALGLTGLSKVRVDVNLSSFFKPGTDIRDGMDFMDNEMTGTMDLRLRVEGNIQDPNLLKKMCLIQDYMEVNDKVSISYSIADIVKQMHRIVMDDNPNFETIPQSEGKVNNLFTIYSISGDPEDFSSFVDYDYQVGLITALSKVMSTEEIFNFVMKITEYIKKEIGNNTPVEITGMIVVFRDMVLMIIRSSLLSIIFSLIIIGVIASLFFNSFLWGLLAVVPLTSAVIINFGLMGHSNIALNHITAILSAIIIGVGVDFAIHYISQFRRLSNKIEEKYITKEVMQDVGYPILLDAGSNMGFGALLFSAFIPVQYMGGLMVFAMISTSLGTLTILSSLAEMLKYRLIVGE